jgi:hypothetical protein
MILQLLQGWKFDTTITGAAAGTASYKTMIKTWYYQAHERSMGTMPIGACFPPASSTAIRTKFQRSARMECRKLIELQ